MIIDLLSTSAYLIKINTDFIAVAIAARGNATQPSIGISLRGGLMFLSISHFYPSIRGILRHKRG